MKVCILAAGRGTRMGQYSETVHKALLPLGNKAVIGLILEQFQGNDVSEFVVAVGHRKDQIRNYLAIAYPALKFHFVEVENYDGPGSGPGLSLFECRHALQEPFIFTACDTLVTSKVPTEAGNWMGVKVVEDVERWCSVAADQAGRVTDIFYKVKADTDLAFVGIAGVEDYAAFWEGLERDRGLLGGELQVDNGLKGLVRSGLRAVEVGWQDAGNEEHYQQLLGEYDKNFSFKGKITDVTYKHADRVIKFFEDESVARQRYERAVGYRDVFVNVEQCLGGFYAYPFVPGTMLSEVMDGARCRAFLDWAQDRLWREQTVVPEEFTRVCRNFYYDKTAARLASFARKYSPEGESALVINGVDCLPAADLMRQLPEDFYRQGLPSTYHGDLHDDNVVVTDNGGYVLIDWRQSFGDSFDAGDRYYDLAKFLHTLELPVAVMDAGTYQARQAGTGVTLEHPLSLKRREAMACFWDFCRERGYDQKRIEIIDAVIYLNMAPLYDEQMARYLYLLGRHGLHQALHGGGISV